MGLLIVLIVIVIGLLYFISKQVRENKTRLQVGLADLEALKNKVNELDAILQNNRSVNIQDLMNKQNLQFSGDMYEEDINLDDDNEITNDNEEFNFYNKERLENTDLDVDEDIDVDDDVNDDDVDDDVNDDINDDDVDEDVNEDVDEDDDDVNEDDEDIDEDVDEGDVDEGDVDEGDVDEGDEDVGEDEVEKGNEVQDENGSEGVGGEDEEEVSSDKLEGDNILKNLVIEESTEKKKIKKKHKQPSKKAKEYPVGYQLVSEHDDCNYEVTLDKKNRARWKRIA